jgi:hypothetical protein
MGERVTSGNVPLMAAVALWLTQHGLREADCSSIVFDRATSKMRTMRVMLTLDLAAFAVAFGGKDVTVDDTGNYVIYEITDGAMKFRAIGADIPRKCPHKAVMVEPCQVSARGVMNME